MYLEGQERQLLYQGDLLSLVSGMAPGINMNLEGGQAPLFLVHQADLLLYISFQVRECLSNSPQLVDALRIAFFGTGIWQLILGVGIGRREL